MKLLIEYFDSGNIFQNRYAFDYRVSKLEDITPPLRRSFHFSPPPSLGGSQFRAFLVLTNLFVSKPVLKKLGGRRGKKYKIRGLKALDFLD